jgi:AbrB family looped-hinge helix DNA binding protein
MPTVTISSKGQIAIPARIRRELHLERASRLDLSVERDRLVLTPVRDESWRSLRGSHRGARLTAWIEEEHRRERSR